MPFNPIVHAVCHLVPIDIISETIFQANILDILTKSFHRKILKRLFFICHLFLSTLFCLFLFVHTLLSALWPEEAHKKCIHTNFLCQLEVFSELAICAVVTVEILYQIANSCWLCFSKFSTSFFSASLFYFFLLLAISLWAVGPAFVLT